MVKSSDLSEISIDLLMYLADFKSASQRQIESWLISTRNLSRAQVRALLEQMRGKGLIGAIPNAKKLRYHALIDARLARVKRFRGLLDEVFLGQAPAASLPKPEDADLDLLESIRLMRDEDDIDRQTPPSLSV